MPSTPSALRASLATAGLLAAALLGTFLCAPAFAQDAPGALAINRNSGMCAEAPAGGTAVAQRTCVDSPSQQWRLQPAAGGAYQVVNRASGLCLGVAGASTADGAAVQVSACGAAGQGFVVGPDEDWSRVTITHSGLCLDVDQASIDVGGALVQRACGTAPSQDWTLSEAAAPSRWSEKIALPIVPVAASTLRNGKILAWSSYDRFAFYSSADQGKTYTTLFNPETGKASEKLVSNTSHDMFCPGTATLPDGRILVNGGNSSGKTSIYDPTTNAWSAGPEMNVPRGYQGDTVLSTGDVLTVGGSWSGGIGGKIGEVWSTEGGWRSLPNIDANRMAGPDPAYLFYGDNHMWLFGMADGVVFHAGPGAEMFWLTTDGEGSMKSAGLRGDDPYSQNGNAVYFDRGKILKAGGGQSYTDGKAIESAYVVDFSRGPKKQVRVTKQKPMAFPRSFATGVALPNGEVLIVGGQSYALAFSDERSILVPEIWSPETGAFRRLAPMQTPRNYHSVAVLMRDARVWVGGGGLCGSCDTNHADAEILTPPYLLTADGAPVERPSIEKAPSSASLGQRISVTTDRAVASFSLVRLSAATHSVNNDQRRLALPIKAADGLTYKLALPEDRGTLLGGDWMLFAIDAAGAPSVSKIVRIK